MIIGFTVFGVTLAIGWWTIYPFLIEHQIKEDSKLL